MMEKLWKGEYFLSREDSFLSRLFNSEYMNSKLFLAASFVLAVILILGLSQEDEVGLSKPQGSSPAPKNVAPTIPQAPPPAPHKIETPESVNSKIQKSLSPASHIDTLAKSKDPKDNYEAYRLIKACVDTRAQGELLPLTAKRQGMSPGQFENLVCGDLSPGQLASRTILIERAARAHVPGAAVDYITQAPDGRPRDEVWNEPAYQQWKIEASQLIRRAAENGDVSALLYVTDFFERGPDGKNATEAIKYYSALRELAHLRVKELASPGFDSYINESIDRLAKDITPKETQNATAAGAALIQSCCKGK